MSKDVKSLLDALVRAAQVDGYASDQGSSEDAQKAAAALDKARMDLEQALARDRARLKRRRSS